MNPDLSYCLLAVAPGYEATVLDDVAPDTSVILTLRPVEKAGPDGAVVRGVVRDDDGRSVSGARVTPLGLRLPNRMRFGPLPGTSKLSVSDRQGRFVLRLGDSHADYFLRVQASGLSPAVVVVAPRRVLDWGAVVVAVLSRTGTRGRNPIMQHFRCHSLEIRAEKPLAVHAGASDQRPGGSPEGVEPLRLGQPDQGRGELPLKLLRVLFVHLPPEKPDEALPRHRAIEAGQHLIQRRDQRL